MATYSSGKAYLNWVLLDEEQLKLVTANGNSGAIPIPAITGSMEKQLMAANGGNEITVAKNGYLYVYVSNESQGNVYFDDLRVEHVAGQILEETHYYPFGLTMAGISSKAAAALENKAKFNGIEFNNDLDLSTYDAFYRTNDPQLGRWWQIDPKLESFYALTPYNSMGNNPVKFNDPLGDIFDEESQKTIDALKKKISERQSELNAQRKDLKSQISDAKKSGDKELSKSLKGQLKDVNAMRAELSTAKTEVGLMESSKQLFRIKEFSGEDAFGMGRGTAGVTTYSASDKAVVVAFTNNSYDVLIHELKHGFDFLTGEISFIPNPNFDYNIPSTYFNSPENRISSLHDMNDEYRAFDRASALNGITYDKKALYEGYKNIGYNLSLASKNLNNTVPPKKEVYFKTHKN